MINSSGSSLKPLVDKPESAVRDNVLAILRDETSGLALEAGTQIVMDGLGPLLSRLEVGRGMNVETDDLRLGALARQASLEELAEEVVVPVSLLVESVREEAPMLEIGQLAPAVMDTGKALGNLWGDLLKN